VKKLYSIQFLRFIAATAVVIHHFLGTLSISGGYKLQFNFFASGVDTFFVISGVVIGLCIEVSSFTEFMAKRAIRVFPMLWIGTFFYVAVRKFTGDGTFGNQTIELIHALIPWPSKDPNWLPIHSPSWTIQFELAFYIVAGLTIAFVKKNRLAACTLLILLIGTLHIPRLNHEGSQATYYSTSFFLEFGIGLFISMFTLREIHLSKSAGILCIVAAVTALILNDLMQLGYEYLVVTFGFPGALLVLGFLAFDDEKWLSNRFLVLGGDASYSIYMTHLSVIQLMFYYGLNFHYTMDRHPIVFFMMTVPSAVLVGLATHLIVERPILRALKKIILPNLVFLSKEYSPAFSPEGVGSQ
jgi:exopolysaccharide production protein ExoZ